MQIENDPWEYGVIDDFYHPSLLTATTNEIIRYMSNLKNFSQKMTLKTTNTDFSRLFPKTLECLESRKIDETYLEKFTEYRPYTKLVHYSEINILLGEFEYPIHDEAPRKILSVVTYLAPEQSAGTLLYDKDKKFSKEIEWKPNRTFIFPGKTGVTWHNYKSYPNSLRITINTFLVDESDLR